MTNNAPRGLISWFTHNPVAANLLMFAILAIGLMSFFTIEKSLTPTIESNTVFINIFYPGAAPEEVERSVTIKVEEQIKDLEGISRFSSISDKSFSSIQVQVADGYDTSELVEQIQSKVDSIISFPQEIERPIINRQNIRRQALMLQLYGDMNEVSMKVLAEQLKMEMLQEPQLRSVEILGSRNFEISIEISDESLRRHNLTMRDIVTAINSSSINIPGGSIKTSQGNILLRTKGQAYDQYDFERLVLKTTPDSGQILLGDVATVKDGFEDVEGFARFNGKPSLALAVYAVADQDIIEVAKAANEFANKRKQSLPDSIELITWADVTYYLDSRLHMMTGNLFMGAILVFVILALFLDLNTAFWVMAGLPVCFLGTFMMMPLEPFNVSLNMISLFGFLLVLGIVVDDAIIIGESVHAQVNRFGKTIDNVVQGATTVAMPATFGVLTTIAAFAPTIFVSGAYSALPAAVGYVVIFCLTFSLIESKWILPAHLAHAMARSEKKRLRDQKRGKTSNNALVRHTDKLRQRIDTKLNHFIDHTYRPWLDRALSQRYITVSIFVALFVLTLGCFASGLVRVAMFPDIPSDFLVGKLEMHKGTSAEQLRQGLKTMETALENVEQEYLKQHDNQNSFIDHELVLSNDGQGGMIMVELSKNENRQLDSNQIIERWRAQVGGIVGAKHVSFSSIEDAGGPPLAFKLIGTNIETLTQAGDVLAKHLQTYDGVFDAENGGSNSNNELHISLKPSANSLGLSLADVGQQVRQAFYGAEAQRLQRGTSEVKVMVRYPKQDRESLATLQDMLIDLPNGEAVPISSVATITMEHSQALLTRVNGEKAITVTARIDKGKVQPSAISKQVMKQFANELKAQFPNVTMKPDGALVEEQKMLKELFMSFGLALLAIYILLAIPLKSYLQPLIIMAIIPFGLIGAVAGHMVMDLSVNMLSFFGMIALSGVVVNDSLVLVSFMNDAHRHNDNHDLQEAAADAAVKRFRAIIITSLTTFCGLLPMLFETSLQAQLVIPMAVSLSYGIVFATFITLFLTPALCLIVNDFTRQRSTSTF